MSAFEDNVEEKVDITDIELQNSIQENYKSVGRVWALKYLFQCDVTDNGIPTDSNKSDEPQDEIIVEDESPKEDTIYDLFWEQIETSETVESASFFRKAKRHAEKIIKGVRENEIELDKMLSDNAEKWDIQRMDVIDRNIIRAALFEMKYCPDTPPVVCITEAVKISKVFGSDNSRSFVNGILNAVMKSLYPDIKKTSRKRFSKKSKKE